MGFFSWLTADTNESIANIHSSRYEGKTVYLLQPDGQPPIEEKAYQGYGDFGGIDAYAWLATRNLPSSLTEKLNDEQLRLSGIALELGKYYEDKDTGKKYVYAKYFAIEQLLDEDIKAFAGHYETIEPDYGKTPNRLIESGQWIKKGTADLIGGIQHPLKFSYDKDAVYEKLPASEDCPAQGYFY